MILKILFLPFALLYLFTFSLVLMPIIYARNKLGTLLFAPIWLINITLILISTVIDFVLKTSNTSRIEQYFNKLSNKVLGYNTGRTVSDELGARIDSGKASWVSCLHCRILATYDSAGWHCSKNATKLF